MGPQNDGGYLLPDDLKGLTSCFSPGVSFVSGFEVACATLGMNVYMADGSVKSPPDSHPRFHFLENFIGAYSHDEFITMEQWVDLTKPDPKTDWMLQMDIEGAEYEVLLNLSERLIKRFRIIVIEFHLMDYLFDQLFFLLAESAFRKLLGHHSCVHIHPNNCSSVITADGLELPKTMEFTFHRRDRIQHPEPTTEFPHPFDSQCVPHFKPLNLPSCWFKL
jgi:Methyltransferase FkbM domain